MSWSTSVRGVTPETPPPVPPAVAITQRRGPPLRLARSGRASRPQTASAACHRLKDCSPRVAIARHISRQGPQRTAAHGRRHAHKARGPKPEALAPAAAAAAAAQAAVRRSSGQPRPPRPKDGATARRIAILNDGSRAEGPPRRQPSQGPVPAPPLQALAVPQRGTACLALLAIASLPLPLSSRAHGSWPCPTSARASRSHVASAEQRRQAILDRATRAQLQRFAELRPGQGHAHAPR